MADHKSRPWNKKRAYTREPIDRKDIKQTFLIVCEGERTEPNYFSAFRLSSANIEIIGEGYNTKSLVNRAIKIRDELKSEGHLYDQCWCVFYKDSFPAEDFNEAFDIAKKNKIKVAYSNECFELWYLLHFEYLEARIGRQRYSKKLTKHLKEKINNKIKYVKNSETMYEDIKPFQKDAIRNANKLLRIHGRIPFTDKKPSTTVHKLVNELNKYI